MTYFNPHSHTVYSNLRLLDAINKPKDLIDTAISMGLSGIAITDHETLSAHVEVNQIMQKYKEKYPDFTIALGNEIYLVNDRSSGQKYFHFILIAKDAIGHKALRELSSTAWFYSYKDRNLERVPTLKSELEEIVKKYSGHLIATTACLGGELPSLLLEQSKIQEVDPFSLEIPEINRKIAKFLNFCLDLFKDDFYIECAPSAAPEQVNVNKLLLDLSITYNIPLVVGTDAHYLTVKDRKVHKAYLNSKDKEREVDSFYEFARLMDANEVTDLMLQNGFQMEDILTMFKNSEDMKNKIQYYSLFHKQDIPSVEVKDYPKAEKESVQNYPNLTRLFKSDDIQDRYWVNQCLEKLTELNKVNDIYLTELEEEARVKTIIGNALETNMFRYPNTLQHYINLIWESGSTVGAGRGSSCAALNHYLMGERKVTPYNI